MNISHTVPYILIGLLLLSSCKKDNQEWNDKNNGTLSSAIESGAKILWIGAHPDDETVISGVLFAKCVEHDGEIKMITLTAGKYGGCCPDSKANGTCPSCIDTDTCTEYLGKQRESEFMTTADLFKAQGEVWWWDDDLVEENYDYAVAQIENEIKTFQPDILITHAPKGGYGHADHISCNIIVTDAFHNLQTAEQPEYFFYALHRHPEPPSVDTESATDIMYGSEFSSIYNKTFWEVALEGLSLFSTQCDIFEKGLKATDDLKNNYFFEVESR